MFPCIPEVRNDSKSPPRKQDEARSPAADTVGDHSGHCPEGEIGGNRRAQGPGGARGQNPRILADFGGFGGNHGVQRVRGTRALHLGAVSARVDPSRAFPWPFPCFSAGFRPVRGLYSAFRTATLCLGHTECGLATQNVAWPHRIWPGHTVAWPQCPSLGITQPGCAGGAGGRGTRKV